MELITVHEVWYADDVTLYPASMIWRIARQQGLRAPLIFGIFYVRKLLSRRFPASYGTMKPDRLQLVSVDEIPLAVREQMAEALAACKAANFRPCFVWKPRFIGGRISFAVFLLSDDGVAYGSVIWFRISVASQSQERVVFACHSLTTQGIRLNTAAVAASTFHRELIPEDHDLQVLPPEAHPADMIAAHRARIVDRKDLRIFDCDSLQAHVLEDTRANIEWRATRGFLVPLTESEVQMLRSSTEPA